MYFNTLFQCVIGLFFFICLSSTSSLLRTKRIDVELPSAPEKSTNIRTKRIGNEFKERNGDEIKIRTKRIDLIEKENTEKNPKISTEIRTKRIDNIARTKRIDDNKDTKRNSINERTKRIDKNERTKRIDENENTNQIDKNKRKKRIDIKEHTEESLNKKKRTKRIDKKENTKKIDINEHNKSNAKKSIKPTVQSMMMMESNTEILKTEQQKQEARKRDMFTNDVNTNDINKLRQALFGHCRGQKINQTFSAKNCEEVTVESLVCGGVCQYQALSFNDITNLDNAYDTCSFCGPLDYEEKIVIMHCHSGNVKRRRWKIEVHKLYVPKTCGCLEQPCHKLNSISREQHYEQLEENSFL